MVSDLQRLRRYKLQEGDGEPDSNLAELIADIHWAADEIERLRKGWESLEWESKQEIERLEALTEADGKEIGSYRKGTGLRGENRAMMDRIEQLEALLKVAKCPNSCVDGVIHATRLGEVYDEIEPCQWCAEKAALENKDER